VTGESEPLYVEGGLAGLRPGESMPLPNAADAAWERLVKLRAEAEELGIVVDQAWPIVRLEEEIAAVKARARGGRD